MIRHLCKGYFLLLTCLLVMAVSHPQAWSEQSKAPEVVDLRVDKAPLLSLVEHIARQARVGLAVDADVSTIMMREVTLFARDVAWADALQLFENEYNLTITFEGGLMRVRSVDQAWLARLELQFYETRHLTTGMIQFPGTYLMQPNPGGTGSALISEIHDTEPPTLDQLMDLIQSFVDPESWSRLGVGMDERMGQLSVIQSPEAQAKIKQVLTQVEAKLARSLAIKIYRVPSERIANSALSSAEFAALDPLLLGDAIGVILLSDGQRNFHFAGQEDKVLHSYGISGDQFEPLSVVARNGIAIDVSAQMTAGGALATSRIQYSQPQQQVTRELSIDGVALPAMEHSERDFREVNDTRFVPAGGALVYRLGEQSLILQYTILNYDDK